MASLHEIPYLQVPSSTEALNFLNTNFGAYVMDGDRGTTTRQASLVKKEDQKSREDTLRQLVIESRKKSDHEVSAQRKRRRKRSRSFERYKQRSRSRSFERYKQRSRSRSIPKERTIFQTGSPKKSRDHQRSNIRNTTNPKYDRIFKEHLSPIHSSRSLSENKIDSTIAVEEPIRGANSQSQFAEWHYSLRSVGTILSDRLVQSSGANLKDGTILQISSVRGASGDLGATRELTKSATTGQAQIADGVKQFDAAFQQSNSIMYNGIDLTKIPNVENANWMFHFYKYQFEILKNIDSTELGTVTFLFDNRYVFNLNRRHVTDIVYLYKMKHHLCPKCYHGRFIGTNNKHLLCKNCVRLLPQNICNGRSRFCLGIKYINNITYSTYDVCVKCNRR
jgi:hypothetical protein